MQLTDNKRPFDARKVEQTLITENKYITDLFSILAVPKRNEDGSDEEAEDQANVQKPNMRLKDTTRAKSHSELQQRLEAITSKKKLTYKEKLTKKGLKNRMKKKSKQDERNAKQKLLRAQKVSNGEAVKSETVIKEEKPKIKPAKPVFNSEGKMVFSKFDFSGIGESKKHKKEKDPKKLLENLEKEKEKLKELKERGEVDKAIELKEKMAWKNVLAKAEGEKVKDDPTLLKKSVQKQEQVKRSSKKKWEARQVGVEKAKADRQKKRTENIEKRKNDKKKNKLKKAAKKGKIIPGY